jgi:hypothetical protein
MNHSQVFRYIKQVTVLMLFLPLILRGQAVNNQIKDVVMPSANAASLGKYGDIPVSYYTGVPSVSVPITTIQDGSISLPVSLSYHAGGVKVGELANWVGLNWSLQAGGMISRTVQGRPDERENGYFSIGNDITVTTDTCVGRISNNGSQVANSAFAGQLSNGEMDGEPDIFSFSIGGYNGKFYIDAGTAYGNGKVVLIPKQDVKIEYSFIQNYTETAIYKFTVTTPDGNKYEFGDIGDGSPAIEVTRPFNNISTRYANGWYLKRVSTIDNKSKINLTYTKEIYRYGYRTSNGSALTGTMNTPTGGYLENVVDIFGYRLDNITTSLGNEKVSFIVGEDRTDVKTTPGALAAENAKRLASIKVENGSYCKSFVLTHTYFTDNSGKKTSQDTDNRLKLDKVQEFPCVANVNTPPVEPYVFTYNGKPGNESFLPNRLSSAIDHWGYFNDVDNTSTNPNLGLNIPYTRLRYYDPRTFTYPSGTTVVGRWVNVKEGNSNRETNETAMIWGTLKQIKYPTGGNTLFDFEANNYWDTEGRKVLQDQTNYTLTHVWSSGSCVTSTYTNNPLTSPTPSSSFLITFTSEAEIDAMFYKWETTHPTYTATCADGNIAAIRVLTTSNNLEISYASVSGSNFPNYSTQKGSIRELFNNTNFLPNVQYKFEMRGMNVGSQFIIQKEVTVDQNTNRKIGGLRIKKVTASDGANPANDVSKTYKYILASPNRSSGQLFNKPIYGYVKDYIPSSTCNGISTTQQYTHFWIDGSIVPLSGFEGHHIAYSLVH